MERIAYRLVRSDRKTISIQLSADGAVVVRAPRRVPLASIDAFVERKRDWIETHRRTLPPPEPRLTESGLRELRVLAKQCFPGLVARYAPVVGVDYGTVTIRAQRSRWGSCSGKGNLSFNCLLMLLPESVQAYVVVHELCHRREMNHSPRFWAEVERVLPDYRQSRLLLKQLGSAVIRRLP